MLAHSAPQCAGIDIQQGCSTIFAVKLPVGLPERPQNMIAFDFIEGLDRIGGGDLVGGRFLLPRNVQLQAVALGMDD